MRKLWLGLLLGLLATTSAYAQQFDVSNTSVNGKTLTAILGTPTGAMQLPSGTTLQEPDTGNPGELRYNTTTGRFEFGVGGAWDNFVRLNGDVMTGALTAPSINTTTLGASGISSFTGGGTFSGKWNNSFFYPTLDTTGTVSDDAVLQAEVNACAAVGGTIYLPAGKILLNGSAGTINLQDCRLIGAGPQEGGTDGSSYGTEIDLTSTTIPPFTSGTGGWEIDNVNFYWPNQTGAIVYPPLFQAGASGETDTVLLNDDVINAYDIINVPSGNVWNLFDIIGGKFYAAHAMLNISGIIGDSWHWTGLQIDPGPWLVRCGYTTACKGYIDTAASNNAIVNVGSTGNTHLFISNSADFDWRYGFLVASGGVIANSSIRIHWDGTGTIIDTSANTTPGDGWESNTFGGVGAANCGGQYSYVSNTNTAYHACFNFGTADYFSMDGGTYTAQADGIDTAGGNISLHHVSMSSDQANLSTNTYEVYAQGRPNIVINNSELSGYKNSTYSYGIYAVGLTNPFTLSVTDTSFSNFVSDIQGATFVDTLISNDYSSGTTGPSSVIFNDSAWPVYWSNNQFDKPPTASVSNCGTGATISGLFSGTVNIGNTVPTTACTISLPFRPSAATAGACVFSGVSSPVRASGSGNPPTWNLTFSSDVNSQSLSFICGGNRK